MEVLAPADVTSPPFALCPRYSLLAVGTTSPPAPRGDAEETGASRVDVLRLLRPTGELHLDDTLQVDCVLQAPGLRRVAWSSTLNNGDDDERETVEQRQYPAGVLAGGFNDGTVRIWNPEPAIVSDMKKASVSKKDKPVLMLSEDLKEAKAQKTQIIASLSKMNSEIGAIAWTGKDFFKTTEEERGDDWQTVENDPDWELICKDEPVASHQATTKMKLLTETRDMTGPVLGLAFSEVNRYWMATAAVGERIYIHDLHHPFLVSKKKRELSEAYSDINCQTTCLKWSKTYPTVLASTNDAGVTISSANNGGSAAVKIWDIRYPPSPCHQYGCGASGVLSLSWNCSGQLLASHKNGNISYYNPYKNKWIPELKHYAPIVPIMLVGTKLDKHLAERPHHILPRPSRKEKWCVKYYYRKTFTQGLTYRCCTKFVPENKLCEGDVCVLELLKCMSKVTGRWQVCSTGLSSSLLTNYCEVWFVLSVA